MDKEYGDLFISVEVQIDEEIEVSVDHDLKVYLSSVKEVLSAEQWLALTMGVRRAQRAVRRARGEEVEE